MKAYREVEVHIHAFLTKISDGDTCSEMLYGAHLAGGCAETPSEPGGEENQILAVHLVL
jgi:hypothetical protein